MKRKIWLIHLLSALFAFILSLSAVGCLITGFDLPVTSMVSLVLCCGIFSLLCALLFRLKYGGSLLLCLTALAAVLAWRQEALWAQMQTLLLSITTHFHQVYNWPALGAHGAEAVDLPLMVLAWWTAVSVSFYVCRRKSILTALPSVVLPLVVCLIVTNTVPDEIYLYLLILGTSLLLLTDWVRRNNPTQSVSLAIRMSVPVALALAVLFLLNPQDGYINNATQFQKEIVNCFQQIQTLSEDLSIAADTAAASSERLNLRSVGPKSRRSYTVMRVTSPIDGPLYLRGQDYDTYTGTGWVSSGSRSETFTFGGESVGQLTVTTYGVRDVLYIPYYAAEPIQLHDGCVDNSDNLSRYSYGLALSSIAGTAVSYSQYTELQPDTSLWANHLASEITAGCGTQEEKVQAIGNYVRQSASYDLSTSRMRSDGSDFAQWFLEESDTGYCVHFATAATVLLRAAGIPARYAEGYMVSCRAGEEILISNQSAHAWAEYYDSDSASWRVLEATPPDENAEIETESETEVSLSTESVYTDPSETQAAVTQPSESQETRPIPTPETGETTKQETHFELPGWIKPLLWMILAVSAVVLQGSLRISRKRKIWNRGEPNDMALTRWSQLEQLSRLLGIPLPEELESLAQKAKFSQHTLTREELQQFEHFRRDALRALHELPWYRKWFLRWILAIG